MADLAVKFLIQPVLDIAGIKKISEQAKANISGTFKDLKIIDGASTSSAFSQITQQAVSASKSVGEIGNAGEKAGATMSNGLGGSINNIVNKIKTDLPKGIGEAASKAASSMSEALQTGLAVAGGGLLLKGIDGIIGGFEKLFEKGIAVKKTQSYICISKIWWCYKRFKTNSRTCYCFGK
ncbi:MAG: hypothetical protein NTW25_02215 [Candidatus Kapabacteria bacterium]|nr:hypothetical protein [Candidatus Kapabacteria bacterium]